MSFLGEFIKKSFLFKVFCYKVLTKLLYANHLYSFLIIQNEDKTGILKERREKEKGRCYR